MSMTSPPAAHPAAPVPTPKEYPNSLDAVMRIHPSQAATSTATDPRVVAHIALGTNVGGMERLLVEFARHSDARRFKPAFLSLQSRGPMAELIEAANCPVFAFDKTEGVRPGLVFRLAWTLRRLRAQVVHTHNTAGMVYGVPAALLARVPRIIHTRHGQRFKDSRRQSRLFRLLAHRVHRVVCVSHDSHRMTTEEGIRSSRIATIGNGVDLSRFQFAGRDAGGPIVLVARLSPEKNVDALIRAVLLVNKQLCGRRLRLHLIGDGTAKTDLQRLTQDLGIEDLVDFLGQQEDVVSALSGCSMFVLPSLTEGISLSLLEAMASGLPVVATDVGGNGEVIRDGQTGLLVPAGDVDALAAAMLRLATNETLAERLRHAARRDVEQRFSIQTMITRYEQLYDEGAVHD